MLMAACYCQMICDCFFHSKTWGKVALADFIDVQWSFSSVRTPMILFYFALDRRMNLLKITIGVSRFLSNSKG